MLLFFKKKLHRMSNTLSSLGKFILGGSFTDSGENAVFNYSVDMLNPDGSHCDTFSLMGKTFNIAVDGVVPTPDGKFYVYGQFSTFGGVACQPIIRLNADGSLDPTFNFTASGSWTAPVQSPSDKYITSVTLMDNGDILCGYTYSDGGIYVKTTYYQVVRISSNGAFVSLLVSQNSLDGKVKKIKILPSGKILIGGEFTRVNGTARSRLARLNQDYSLDSSVYHLNSYKDFEVLDNGNIVVLGVYYYPTSVSGNEKYLTMFTPDGTYIKHIETQSGKYPISIALQTDGKILVGGDFTSIDGRTCNRLVRFNSDLTFDSTFSSTSSNNINSVVRSIYCQLDGKILVGGNFTKYVTRLNDDGTVDTTFFNPLSGFDSAIMEVSATSSGTIACVGYATSFNRNIPRVSNLVTYGTHGDLSNSTASGSVECIDTYNDKVLVGGTFTSVKGVVVNRVARINNDGSIDTSFAIGTGFNSTVTAVKTLSTGKILVGGAFSMFNGLGTIRLCRLNSDGTLDVGFNVGTGLSSVPYTIVELKDGKVLVGGAFLGFNGVTVNRIAKLTSDGTLENIFGTGFNSSVRCIQVLSDGKILVGGHFTTYNGVSCNKLIRLNPDGTIDMSFNTGTINGHVYSIAIQTDGKIVIGGTFTTVNSITANRLVRLNQDGTLDDSFNTGTGFSDTVNYVALRSNGDIYVGGLFSSFNGIYRAKFAVLDGTGTLVPAQFNISGDVRCILPLD